MPCYAVAVLEGALGASVAVTLDVLAAARQVAEALDKPAIGWRLLASRRGVALSGGLRLGGEPISERTRLGRDALVVPGLGIGAPDELPARLARPDARHLAALARRHAAEGGMVAASCSGVFVLGQGGVLAGRRATTAWWLADLLGDTFPDCELDASAMVVEDGPVVTAGAALAQMDLMLHLLRRDCGAKVADLTARYLLIEGRPAQSRYMVWSHLRRRDGLVGRLEALVARRLPAATGVAEAAAALHVTERTLHRHVLRATGRTPSALIQSVRLQRAHHLLETTGLPVEEVARRVGYGDATALRRLVRKAMRVSPRDLRRPDSAGRGRPGARVTLAGAAKPW